MVVAMLATIGKSDHQLLQVKYRVTSCKQQITPHIAGCVKTGSDCLNNRSRPLELK